MSHTPGPWKVLVGGLDGDEGFSIGTDNAASSRVKVTCECWPCTIIDNEHREELRMNASLIAAAPELLSACVSALWELQTIEAVVDGEVRDELLRVIRKASGVINAK